MLFTETGRTAYLNAAVASQAAPGLELSTGVAVAFPRSPFVTAATAWELQEATGGKFRLGPARRYAPCRAAIRHGVRSSGSAAARLRARGEGVLHARSEPGSWITTASSTTWTSSRRSGARDRSTHRSESRYRSGESVDAADGGRGGRWRACASAGRAGLSGASCDTECG